MEGEERRQGKVRVGGRVKEGGCEEREERVGVREEGWVQRGGRGEKEG